MYLGQHRQRLGLFPNEDILKLAKGFYSLRGVLYCYKIGSLWPFSSKIELFVEILVV